MLGVVIANSLLLLFMCWEIVGLTSYLLIGFWYQQAQRGRGGEEGLHHHAHRRPWLPARHGLAVCAKSARCSSTTTARDASSTPRSPPWWRRPRVIGMAVCRQRLRCSSSAAPPANPARCRCTSGCQTRWKAPRRSARSFTPPPWSPPASILVARVYPLMSASQSLLTPAH